VDHFKQHTIQKKIRVKTVLRDSSQTTQVHTSPFQRHIIIHCFKKVSSYSKVTKHWLTTNRAPRSFSVDTFM